MLKIHTSGAYSLEWKKGLIQAVVREKAGHKCEWCQMEFTPGTNLAVTAVRRDGKKFVGTVHHLDGNKSNNDAANLVFLCQRCNLKLHFAGWIPGLPLPNPWSKNPPLFVFQRGLPYMTQLDFLG